MNRHSNISTHFSNDDAKYWRFERTSGLPHGYFGHRIRLTPDLAVALALLLAAIALLVLA
jgi:hypothetical protein